MLAFNQLKLGVVQHGLNGHDIIFNLQFNDLSPNELAR
jgi:hypothetical protein